MNMKTLKRMIQEEIEKCEAEYTNVPESEHLLLIEIDAWIQALTWILQQIESDKNE